MSLFLRRVVGHSMSPTLLPSDLVVGSRIKKPFAGNVVVANVNGREVIKRVDAISDKKLFLKGDNAQASTDSRQYGAVGESAILGVIVMKIRFGTASAAPKPTYRRLLIVPYGLAASLIGVLLISLFYFEKLVVFMGQNFTNDSAVLAPKIYSAAFALVLLFSLPFLLRMALSPLARFCSALLVLSLPIFSVIAVVLYELYGDNNEGLAMVGFSVLGILALASFHILGGRQALEALAKRV